MKLYRNNRLILFLALATIFISSCKIGKNYTQPEVNLPNKYLFADGDTTANKSIEWWTLFNNSELDTLVKDALIYNKDLQKAVQSIEQAKYQLSIQKAEMLPKFSATAQAGHGTYLGVKTDDATSAFMFGAQTSWELDFWGKYRRLNEASKAQYIASEYGVAAIQIDLITTVATTYFQLLENRRSLSIAQSTLALRDSSLDIIQQRFDAGIIPQIDVNHAQIQRSIAASSIPFYKRQAAITENTLNVLIGRNPTLIKTNQQLLSINKLPEIPAGMPSQLLERRPDILYAEQQLVSQNALIGVAQANRLPGFSLTGLLGVASNDLNSLTSNGLAWNVGGSIMGPLFNWRQYANQVKIERSKYEAALLTYEGIIITALKDVENALVTIETLKEEEIAVSNHVTAATKAMQLSSERYDKGIASYIEYLESQRQAYEAQLSLTRIHQQVLSAYIKLYKSLGGGWEIQ